MKDVVDVFGKLPLDLSPTQYIRRWDHAAILGGLACATTLGAALVGSSQLYDVWGLTTWDKVQGMLTCSDYFLSRTEGVLLPKILTMSSAAIALTAGGFAFKWALRPYNHEKHTGGFRRIEGEEVQSEMHKLSHQWFEKEHHKPWMHLHPDLQIPKNVATLGGMASGGAGSGKSVFLKQLIRQHFDAGRRLVAYDKKGDITQIYGGKRWPTCRLFNPWDARSVRWMPGRDINTPVRAKAFATGLFPPGDGKDAVWNLSSAQITADVIVELQKQYGEDWHWNTLANALGSGQAALYALLRDTHPLTAQLIENPTAGPTSSILMNISAFAGFIGELAQAWPESSDAEDFSWVEWVTSPKTKKRQIIIGAGPDKASTSQLLGAVFNLVTNLVCSLKDNEHGRSLCFFFDEFPTIAKFEILDLYFVGRSKGAVTWIAYQHEGQVKTIYGEDMFASLQATVGINAVFRMSGGAGTKAVAENFGYNRVASTLPQYTLGEKTSTTISIKEESKALIDASDITLKLGPVHRPDGSFYIRGLLSIAGQNPMFANWEGKKWINRYEERVAAAWTKAPVKAKTWRQLHALSGADTAEQLDGLRQMITMFEEHNKRANATQDTQSHQEQPNPTDDQAAILARFRQRVGDKA